MTETDQVLLKKFQKLMRIANRISQAHAAEMLEITESALRAFLFRWGDSLSFKLDGIDIVIEDLSQFQSDLDGLFDNWEDNERKSIGKVETPELIPNHFSEEKSIEEVPRDFTTAPHISRGKGISPRRSKVIRFCCALFLMIPIGTFLLMILLFNT